MASEGAMGPPARMPARSRIGTSDVGVQSTNDDAQLCKLSCVNAGYFQDPFLKLFVKRAQRKSPLINRGYWTRWAALRQVLHQFLLHSHQQHLNSAGPDTTISNSSSSQQGTATSNSTHCQVVVLGAGFDTTWFQLSSLNPTPEAAAAAPTPAPPDPGATSSGVAVSTTTSQQLGQPPSPATPATAAAAAVSASAGLPSLFGRPAAAAAGAPQSPGAAEAAAVLQQHTRYIEVDFPEVAAKKVRSILSYPQLWQLLPDGCRAMAEPHAAEPADPSEASPRDPANHSSSSGNCPSPRRLQQAWVKGGGASDGTASAGGPNPTAAGAGAAAVTPVEFGVSAVGTMQPPQHNSGAGSSSSSGGQAGSPAAVAVAHGQELLGGRYSLVGGDLRQLQQLEAALGRAGWDARVPTLWVSECCLIYLDAPDAAAVLSWAAGACQGPAAVCIYEQTRPQDAFGRMMLSNLEERGCPLRSVGAVPTPAHQTARLQSCGWPTTAAADMHRLFLDAPGCGAAAVGGGSAGQPQGWWLPWWVAERARVQRLEMLDELEEWQMLQEHYVLVLGVKGQGRDPAAAAAAAHGVGAAPGGPAAGQHSHQQLASSTWLEDALRLRQLAALG